MPGQRWHIMPRKAIVPKSVFRAESLNSAASTVRDRVPELADDEPTCVAPGLHLFGPFWLVSIDTARQRGWRT